MKYRHIWTIGMVLLLATAWSVPAGAEDAKTIVDQAFKYYRGKASVAVVEMSIKRPSWKRTMTMKGWTKGSSDSLIRITAPAKDKGNGTLKKGQTMWMYNPKVNRVLRLPPSMMAQSWMGSDFSNNDLAKSDTLINDYTHEITGTETQGGKKVYLIKSMPKPRAPVIWGMQKLKIRADHIFLVQEFYDEDLKLVKVMTASRIKMLGGKLFPQIWKMEDKTKSGHATTLDYKELAFKSSIDSNLFTVNTLKNPAE